jgi:hypothetical protein
VATIYQARARLSALSRYRSPADPAVTAARGELREARLAEEIRREAEADPPLSTEQRARLAVLLLSSRQAGGDAG